MKKSIYSKVAGSNLLYLKWIPSPVSFRSFPCRNIYFIPIQSIMQEPVHWLELQINGLDLI